MLVVTMQGAGIARDGCNSRSGSNEGMGGDR